MDEHDEVTGRRFRDQPMWKQVTAAVLAGIILAGLAALAHSVRHTQKVTTMGASVGSSASSTRSLMAHGELVDNQHPFGRCEAWLHAHDRRPVCPDPGHARLPAGVR